MEFPSLTAVNGFFGYNLVFAGLRCLLRFGQNDHDILNIQEHNIFGAGYCRQQNLNITKSKTNLQLTNACQGKKEKLKDDKLLCVMRTIESDVLKRFRNFSSCL